MDFVFVISLTFSVCIASSGFNVDKRNSWWRCMGYVAALSAGQGLMYWLGALLGGTFMNSFASFPKTMVLILCFMLAFRMFTDTLKIKNGRNLFFITKTKQLIFLSLALGVNALIAGLMAGDLFLPLFGEITPLLIMGMSLIWGLIAIGTKFSPKKLVINSLVNLMAALLVLVTGIVAII